MRQTASETLHQYYEMMFPRSLEDGEYIRLLAIHTDPDGSQERMVRFVKSYEEYSRFVQKYRFTYDIYNQIATNRGDTDGTAKNQWRRRVLFLDFDKKDHPEIQSARDCMTMIHEKLPKLFIHCIVDSGNGYHCYVCIPQTRNVTEVVQLNKQIAQICGADLKAVNPTQLCRVPTSYNHKTKIGADYSSKDLWKYVTVVNNVYGRRSFRTLDLRYVSRMCTEYLREAEVLKAMEKVEWHYEELSEAPRYLCIRRAMTEGVDKGQRNFWHGRIVAMLQMEGYTLSAIRSECREYNKKCRPPKNPTEIDKDTERFLAGPYKLLGCYEAF